MNTEKFEAILQKPESETLDFKRIQYDFMHDSGNTKTAKFVKDIISFSNTIRTETAYIVIGVSEEEDGSKNQTGLDKNIDDSIFQEKIKNKVTPIPSFKYYTFEYQDKTFGVFEIPVKKYSEPIFPVIRMRGLEPGKVYFRRNSSNSEATGREIILINSWLQSLPSEIEGDSLACEVSKLMTKVTSGSSKVSECISSSLAVAKKYNIENLKIFCNYELTGIYSDLSNIDEEKNFSYRMNKVIMSAHSIEINPFYNSLSSDQMMSELKKMDGFYERQVLFNQSISEIENTLDQYSAKQDTSILALTAPMDQVFNNSKYEGKEIKMYTNIHNFKNIYQGIKQKLINLLLEIE